MSSFLSNILSRVSTTRAEADEIDCDIARSSAKSWSSSRFLVSPKTFLSQVISQALGEFFVFDDKGDNSQHIQSTLLSGSESSSIVLTNLPLRPRVLARNKTTTHSHSAVLRLSGTVDRVEFSWVWGGNDQTSLIREIVLEIVGVAVRMEQVVEGETTEQETQSTAPPSSSSTKGAAQSYFDRYVQQILDHLTLKIQNLKVTVDIAPNSNKTAESRQQQIVTSLQSLSLVSMGKREQKPTVDNQEDDELNKVLSQRLSLEGLSVYVVEFCSERRQSTLLEPLGYAAQVTRTAGRRFQDGLSQGLQVQGEVFYDPNDVNIETSGKGQWTLRLGRMHVTALSDAFEMLAAFAPSTEDEGDPMATIVEIPNDDSPMGKRNDVSGEIVDSTLLILPVPALSLVFEDETARLDLPDCSLTYRLDGTQCQVKGGGSIFINDSFPVLHLMNGSEWILDVIAKSFVVQPARQVTTEVSVVAHLQLKVEEVLCVQRAIINLAAMLEEETPSLNVEDFGRIWNRQ